jgi:histidine triad (HIT) family protein
MYNQEPPDYLCPFCAIVAGMESPTIETRQADIVCRNEHTTGFIASRWWPNNPGHVIVVPNQHIENIYNMPQTIAGFMHETARQIAIGFMECYQCDGTSTRQHNGRDGLQDIWHYHLHVFPRYVDDQLYELTPLRRLTSPEERLPYTEKLRHHLAEKTQNPITLNGQ